MNKQWDYDQGVARFDEKKATSSRSDENKPPTTTSKAL
jgi:hypothetical protein